MRTATLALLLLPLTLAGANRAEPRNAVLLRSADVQVVLDASDALPYSYRLQKGGATAAAIIHGEDSGRHIAATWYNRASKEFLRGEILPASSSATPASVDFAFRLPAATFSLRYALTGTTLRVTLEDVAEKPGFELIDVSMPNLATIREEDGPAWLAHGDSGGSVVALNRATPGHLAPNRFWGEVAGTLPVVMIGTTRALCVEEVTAFMDGTSLSVDGPPGSRRAKLGTVKVYRINGSFPQDMNLAPGEPRVAGNDRTPNLLVGQKSSVRLDFIADYDRNGTVDWLDGAKFVRAHMPPIPTHYYDDKFQYSVHSDEPKYPKPGATFAETRRITKQVANLIAGTPQTVYLWGWQYRGKDTGYPAVDKVNPRLGSFDDLQKLITDARDWSATISFSDNFDDAYKSSPAWDDAIIARRPDGELWKSRNWTGEDSYIIGLAKYMAGPGLGRIRYTCDQYKLKDTYLVDVLTYYAIRNDWDPAHPASGIKNLEARYKVLDAFKACGLDLVSEELRYPFIGKLAVADNGPVGGPDPFGGDAIPLVATIYRKSAIWGLRGPQKRENSVLHTLFYNGHGFPWLTAETDLEDFTSFFYETIVPWYQVHYRDVETFKRDGDLTSIGLAGNSQIDIDWKTGAYTVTVNGAVVAKDGDTFCPLGADRIAFYSRKGNDLSAPLPAGWNAKTIVARALFADRSEPAPVEVSGGRVKLRAPAKRAVVVFREAGISP